jgi:hypothetical protein
MAGSASGRRFDNSFVTDLRQRQQFPRCAFFTLISGDTNVW